MTHKVDFDSLRTHAHAICAVLLICTATAIYAFHSPHAKVIPFVILTSTLFSIGLAASTTYLGERTATQLLLCRMKRHSVLCALIWCAWLIYGSVWEANHRVGGAADAAASAVWVISGLWCTHRIYKRRPVHYAGVLLLQQCLLFIPLESSVAQYLPAWNVLVRVFAFVATYFFNLYARLATELSIDTAYLVCTSLWILFVNQWMLPALGIHWAAQLHGLSRFYSQRPLLEEDDESVHAPDLSKRDVETGSDLRVETPPPALREARGTNRTARLEDGAHTNTPAPERTRLFFNSKPRNGQKGDRDRLMRAASGVSTIT